MATYMASASERHLASIEWDVRVQDLYDDQFHRMKQYLTAEGRGRKVGLTKQSVATNKLLLQLDCLRQTCEKSWDEISAFVDKVCDENIFAHTTLKTEVNRAIRDVSALSCDGDLQRFLETDIRFELESRNIGHFLQKKGIKRHHLLSPETFDQSQLCEVPVTNGLLIDLLIFQKEEGLSLQKEWFRMIGLDIAGLSDKQLNTKLAKTRKPYDSLMKSASRPSSQQKLKDFLSQPPEHFVIKKSLEQNLSPLEPSASAVHLSDPQVTYEEKTDNGNADIKLAGYGRQLAALRRQLEETQAALKTSKLEVDTLKNVLHEKKQHLMALETEMAKMIADKKSSDQEQLLLRDKLQRANRKISTIQQSNYYKRLKRKENDMKKTEHIIKQHQSGGCQRKIDGLRKKLKSSQTTTSNLKTKMNTLKEKMEATLLDQQHAGEVLQDPEELRLKDENGHFKPEAKIAVMELVGESEVPAHRCGAVIRTAARLCGVRIPEGDLPSQRSALRFADQGHVVSKSHVAEVLRSHEHWDLHIDGTSRSGKSYISQQATTASGSFSMGFLPVTTEDTSTLVDIAIQMLEELSDLHPEGASHMNFYHLLLGLSSIMTDRAAVMKSFGRKLEAERQELLQLDEGLEFLHCNAHFLLGLGAESKKALAQDEKEKGEPLGRDAVPGFNNLNSSDCSAYRYIWMACDCLGPRGDDKHGCRDCWEAYCLMVGRASTVTSFRENRFNNMFQAAASLHYHRHDIQECLSSYMPKNNRKIESVLADCNSETIDCHIIVLGLLYFRITGPYWCLLRGSIHYLDFYVHVESLHTRLLDWQTDASPALHEDCPATFPGIHFPHNADILLSLLAIGEEKKTVVTALLQKVCGYLLEVTRRQLADFLPGGKYHNVQDEELRQKLDHSSLTNLVSEECFADLDFSLFKRRNASLHHHSTVNLLKRNKSVSSWLALKTSAEQQDLLKLTARKAAALREKHVQMEKDTVRQKQHLLQEARLVKEAAEERKRQQKMSVMEDLRPHQGPCSSPADIQRLLTIYRTHRALRKALRAEILFQKIILEKKSSLLKVTGSVLKLVNQLLEFFGGEVLERLPAIQPEVQAVQPNKRPRREISDSSEDDSDQSEDHPNSDEDYEEEQTAHNFEHFNFRFRQPEELIAVYFEDDFFIGAVHNILSEDQAEVNFMTKATVGRGASARHVYRWPHSLDVYPINSSVVFASNLTLAPSSSSGRSSVVDWPNDLRQRYDAFKRFLFENHL